MKKIEAFKTMWMYLEFTDKIDAGFTVQLNRNDANRKQEGQQYREKHCR